jgi:hypothetical protein
VKFFEIDARFPLGEGRSISSAEAAFGVDDLPGDP